MAKAKTVFFCQSCGYEAPKWMGQCPGCRQWNTFAEETIEKKSAGKALTERAAAGPVCLSSIETKEEDRMTTRLDELDRVRRPLPVRAAIGAAGISGVEFLFGLVCTRVLHRQVWDYSREWGNVAGLVCPKYSALWFVLCLWLMAVMDELQRRLPHARTAKV